MEALYRVLVTGADDLGTLPLVNEVEEFDSAPQEFCGHGYASDFTGSADNGAYGEVWEFVTFSPAAMEQALNTNPAVIAYIRKG